ncbi:unnamed protein product, partial [Adineta steineri]
DIPIQPTLDPSYTSSPNIPNQDSSSNEELQGVSSKEPLYLIPKTEVNQLRHHTRAYLQSLGEPNYTVMARLLHLALTIIIDTISEIRQPIIEIDYSKSFEDPTNFQEDPTFFNFLENRAGGSGPPEPLDTNPPLDSIPSP